LRPAMTAKHTAIGGVAVSASPTTRTASAIPTDAPANAPGETPAIPAWTSRSRVRLPQADGVGSRRGQNDHQTQSSPAPSSRPATAPISASPRAREQRAQVVAGPAEPVLVGRVADRAHEYPVATPVAPADRAAATPQIGTAP